MQVGARLRVDLQMPVGQVTEKVEVTASSPLLETDSSQRGQVITGDQTRALPLLSREYSSLALLTTGVKLGGSSLTTGNTPREGAFNVNGLRSVFNNFLIDGVDNNAYGTSNQGFSNQVMQPAPDAIGEFKVVTNNMSAEYGRAAGATINVSYRSGTNTLHGAGWEFLRNDSLNATGFFKPATGKPAIDRNQFGGVLGGPIVKNKAFFFGDYEGQRQTRKVTAISSIATPAQRQGIFTVDIRDPAHRHRLSRRHADPDDRVRAARCWPRCPTRPARATPTTTRRCRSSPPTTTRPTARSICRRRRRCRSSAATGSAISTRSTSRTFRCRRAAPATAASTRRNRQAVFGTTWTPSGHVAAGSALRLLLDAGRQEPAGARARQRAGAVRLAGAAERPAHLGRSADDSHHRLFRSRAPGDQSAVAVSDRLQPEGELHLDAAARTRSRPATSSSGSTPKCRT